MSRLIDADALIERMRKYIDGDWHRNLGAVFTHGIEACIHFAEEARTIEAVEVVHGKWIMRGGKKYCTVCGKKALEEKDRDDWYGCVESNFCPNCGADMRKGGANQ